MNKPSTDELLKQLRSAHSVSDLSAYTRELSGQESFQSFSEYITAHIRKQGFSESEIIQASLIPRTYGYQILNGTKNPGRDKVLSLCLAAHLNYEDTQRALALAGLGKLYPRRKKDSVIIFALNQHLSVQQTNELLFEEDAELLE